MRIFPILRCKISNINPTESKRNPTNYAVTMSNIQQIDTVSFGVSKASGEPLRKLAEYGMPDMYTGQIMLSKGAYTKLLENNVFNLPLKKLIPILSKYENTMLKTEHEFFNLMKKAERVNPNLKINDVISRNFIEHQKKLLNIQQPIFAELMQKACDLPKHKYDEFMDFMRETNKRIAKDPIISHFSEKEFIYKLQQVEKQIKSKNNYKETVAIRSIVREAKSIFSEQIQEKKKFGRGTEAKKLKMEYQLQPEVLKQNSQKFQKLQEMFENSVIRNNKDLRNIFDNTRAKIYGFPIIEPFKRQEFIYDLKNILKNLHDKDLEADMINIAHKLPTSLESVSAFIVKHIDDTPDKIGFYLIKDSLCSIEHLEPKTPREETVYKIHNKKKKKVKHDKCSKNHLRNYGLCSVYINSKRTNVPFDEWIRQNPQTYKNCQKYVDRLIELYNEGIFEKVGLEKDYIYYFAKRVKELSPKEKPMVLDLSKLKD